MSVVFMISATAVKKGLEKVVEDIYTSSKGHVKKLVNRWRAKNNIDKLYTKIKNIRMVKTILQPEKAVDLMTFYYPSKVKLNGKRKTINDISDFGFDGNIVVKGTVGNGKSIFFRYLTSREMVKGDAVPIFAELRTIKKDENLIDYLVDEANALGLEDMDRDTFLWLAEHGKVAVFLDGFDEVPEKQQMRLITEIERLAKRYGEMRILVSSRPNSGIENSTFFRVYQMASLEGNEYEDVIGQVAEQEVTKGIIRAIKTSRSGVKELLTTPLMVALLVVRHRIEQTIPENVMGFYDGLFSLLISRHDKLKGGYTRPRKSRLGDSSLQNVFEGICFLTRKEDQGTFKRRDLTKYAKESARLAGYKCEPDNVIEDIIKITCMILEEGEEYKFIQKSVQEYHAACFIKEQPDELAKKFYDNSIDKWGYWIQEILFLSMIDRYRFFKWFLIPDMCKTLDLENETIPVKWETKQKHIHNLYERTHFFIEEESGQCTDFEWGSLPYILQIWMPHKIKSWEPLPPVDRAMDLDYSKVLEEVERKESNLGRKARRTKNIGKRDGYLISGGDLVDSGLLEEELCVITDEVLREVHKELVVANKYVENVEARKQVFEL